MDLPFGIDLGAANCDGRKKENGDDRKAGMFHCSVLQRKKRNLNLNFAPCTKIRALREKRTGLKTGHYNSKKNRKNKDEREGDYGIALIGRKMRQLDASERMRMP
jgi:hypothetical protein